MNARQFFECVAEMRERQRAYLATKDKRELVASKWYEKIVDAEIKRVHDLLNTTHE